MMPEAPASSLGTEALSKENVSEPVTVETGDPLSFDSTSNDYFDAIGLPKEKRAKAKRALEAAIMACMGTDYDVK